MVVVAAEATGTWAWVALPAVNAITNVSTARTVPAPAV